MSCYEVFYRAFPKPKHTGPNVRNIRHCSKTKSNVQTRANVNVRYCDVLFRYKMSQSGSLEVQHQRAGKTQTQHQFSPALHYPKAWDLWHNTHRKGGLLNLLPPAVSSGCSVTCNQSRVLLRRTGGLCGVKKTVTGFMILTVRCLSQMGQLKSYCDWCRGGKVHGKLS